MVRGRRLHRVERNQTCFDLTCPIDLVSANESYVFSFVAKSHSWEVFGEVNAFALVAESFFCQSRNWAISTLRSEKGQGQKHSLKESWTVESHPNSGPCHPPNHGYFQGRVVNNVHDLACSMSK